VTGAGILVLGAIFGIAASATMIIASITSLSTDLIAHFRKLQIGNSSFRKAEFSRMRAGQVCLLFHFLLVQKISTSIT